MKQITLANYKHDSLYPKIVRAVAEIMQTEDVVTPVAVMMQMQRISKEKYEDWRFGRIPYLERAFLGSLGKSNRILRILRMHAHDLNLIPSQTVYCKWGKGKKIVLKFSKTGDSKVEESYSRHFLVPGRQKKHKQAQAPSPSSPNQPSENTES